ncbi:TetR/AcrR family transcriptional regulator C-terminal domain-containing protein [Asticcacaulis solisilvae]|uniref:TetR/AcrR family transcriptional regulator C-terminal domain-containing protein n=1 Tax=Asticcacaulis solisilvae TaxID=1217274 RepID=UPI003FD7F121
MPESASRRLDRGRIVDAAIAIADAEGIAAVTIRRVAEALKAGAMSLYRHVDGKDALLDALADRIAADIPLPESGSGWREGLHARAVATRRICLRHPWAARLLESRLASGPARLRMQEAGLALLAGDGFSLSLACRALTVLDSYIYGFTLRESALPPSDALPDAVRDVAPAIRPEDYPHIVTAMMHAMAEAQKDGGAAALMEADFLFGLDLLLDGFAAAKG